jgi:hypothetical protein
MAQYRKKPVVVEAIQWFRMGDHPKVTLWKDGTGWIKTLEGGHIVTPGDWIIRGVAGEFYPCKPDIFAMTYEPATGKEVMPNEPTGSADGPRNTAPAGLSAGGGAGWRDVLAERQRQISEEGWTPEHDDAAQAGDLANAAACYAMTDPVMDPDRPAPVDWPWSAKWWKPTTPRRDLVKAGALILAEIERLDRAAPPAMKESE